jgi:hypothetical protein
MSNQVYYAFFEVNEVARCQILNDPAAFQQFVNDHNLAMYIINVEEERLAVKAAYGC